MSRKPGFKLIFFVPSFPYIDYIKLVKGKKGWVPSKQDFSTDNIYESKFGKPELSASTVTFINFRYQYNGRRMLPKSC
jgi:hypothetical protein